MINEEYNYFFNNFGCFERKNKSAVVSSARFSNSSGTDIIMFLSKKHTTARQTSHLQDMSRLKCIFLL